MNLQDHDDSALAVMQRTVAASQATPPATRAPNSVFALGSGQAEAGTGGGDDQANGHGDHQAGANVQPPAATSDAQPAGVLPASPAGVRALLQRHGRMSRANLVANLNTTDRNVGKWLSGMKFGGKVQPVPGSGGGPNQLWELAPESGEGPARKAPAKRPAKAAKAPRAAKGSKARTEAAKAPPAAPTPARADADAIAIELGFFDSGEIQIGLPGQPPLRLNAQRTRKLVTWLLAVDAALRPGTPAA